MIKYGMYSQASALIYGTVVWEDEDGRAVVITGTHTEETPYLWNDAVNRGPVSRYLSGSLKVPAWDRHKDFTGDGLSELAFDA